MQLQERSWLEEYAREVIEPLGLTLLDRVEDLTLALEAHRAAAATHIATALDKRTAMVRVLLPRGHGGLY